MEAQDRHRAWRGKPQQLDLVCLFIPDLFSLQRLDCAAAIGDLSGVLGSAGQRAIERMMAASSRGEVTARQWRSNVAILKRLAHEDPDSANEAFLAWFQQALQLNVEARLDPPILSWDLIRLARPADISATAARLQDHWALLQRRGHTLLAGLHLDSRLGSADEAPALRELVTLIRSDTTLRPYWSEASLQFVEDRATKQALELARAVALIQALVSQLGLAQALQAGIRADIDAMVELDQAQGRCNPGGTLLRLTREAFDLPTMESLVQRVQTASSGGPDRSTLMAWSSGRNFPSSKAWLKLVAALRTPEDPDFHRLREPLRQGTVGWAARRVQGLQQTFGAYWPELAPFLGEAENFAAWLGPSVGQWRQHWQANPLPDVDLPMLPSIVQ